MDIVMRPRVPGMRRQPGKNLSCARAHVYALEGLIDVILCQCDLGHDAAPVQARWESTGVVIYARPPSDTPGRVDGGQGSSGSEVMSAAPD